MEDQSWRIALASVVGSSHALTGAPCQDTAKHKFLDTANGLVLVTVICDGAGSATHSDVGSLLAARTFIELVEVHFLAGGSMLELDQAVAARWIDETASALKIHANETCQAVREYACTLLAVIIGESAAAFVQIGDGAIVISQGQEDGWAYVFWPQHGEFANTTNFVVSDGASELVEFELAKRRIDEFAMFSDGLENLVLHHATRTVHGSFFNGMLKPVRNIVCPGVDEKLSRALQDYLSAPKICDRTDDDKSLILATRPTTPRLEREH